MDNYLIVGGVFEIQDRGLVLAGKYPDWKIYFKLNDEIEIENPDGSSIKTTIIGVEHINRRNRPFDINDRPFGFLVKGIAKTQVIPGAKIKPAKK